MTDARPWSERIAAELRRRWPDRRGRTGPRTLGREGEHPIVRADGTAADVSVLWPDLQAGAGPWQVMREGDLIVGLEGPEVAYTAEVGRGTLEVIVGPTDDLHELARRYTAGMAHLVAVAAAHGLTVLGYGIQPVTPPTPALMTHKARYDVLLDRIGADWLHFAVTASDQTHVSVDLDEAVAVANLANLLHPAWMALFANSPVHAGADHGHACGRSAGMGRIESVRQRHGMPAGPSADLSAWVERTLDMQHLIERDTDGPRPGAGTFRTWLGARAPGQDAACDAWLLHEHYVWNAARPRAHHGTVELRSACQQPWSGHTLPSVASAGLVEAHADVAAWLDTLCDGDPWRVMAAWSSTAEREGLRAAPPVPGLLEGLLDHIEAGLVARGRDEAPLLAPLRARVASGRGPAQDVSDAWASGGAEAVVATTAIPALT